MPTLTVDDDELVVRLSGLEAVYALRRTVRVPRADVASVTVGPPPPRRGVRAPGTHVPGMVTMGTWRGRFGKDFWAVRRADRVLVVELPHGRVVVEVDDPDAVAAAVPLPS